jgi:hypothetical protein
MGQTKLHIHEKIFCSHTTKICKIFEVITSTWPIGTLGSVAALVAATYYQGNPGRNHTLWKIGSTERYAYSMTWIKWKTKNTTVPKSNRKIPHCQSSS